MNGMSKYWIHRHIYSFSRDIARFCNKYERLKFIAIFIWRRDALACDCCGELVGFNSVVSRFGFTCRSCLAIKEREWRG